MKKEKFMIVLLALIIVLLVGYIVYDKGIFTQNTKEQTTNKENNKEETKKEEIIEDTSETLLKEEEAQKLGQELWQYAYDSFWLSETVWKRHTEPNVYGGESIVCDTTREEVKSKYTQDFIAEDEIAKESLQPLSLDTFLPMDCSDSKRGGNQLYRDTTLSIKNIKEEEITFTATSSYCDTAFCPNGSKITKTIKKDFIIKKENNNWLIHYFYLPN